MKNPPPARNVHEELPVVISHRDKVFWPEEGYTKLDLAWPLFGGLHHQLFECDRYHCADANVGNKRGVRTSFRSRNMIFKDREDAGRQLAKQLSGYATQNDVIVLGIPRGGVPITFEIAQALGVPMDIFLSRKLGVPGREELAFGAIAAGDGRFLDQEVIRAMGISEWQIERITEKVKETLNERAALYRGDRSALQVENRTVILVDDGIATGASIYAAIHALHQMTPAKLVVAVPVAPPSTCRWLRTVVDELVCLYEPQQFYSVGQFYERFSQVPDEEVIELLQRSWQLPAHTRSAVDCARDG